jgi:1-deoxy-D-xylulose-5-phosphate synthase
MEEGCLAVGFGSAVIEHYNDIGSSVKIARMGIPDDFIQHGSREELLDSLGLNSIGIVNKIKDILGDLHE